MMCRPPQLSPGSPSLRGSWVSDELGLVTGIVYTTPNWTHKNARACRENTNTYRKHRRPAWIIWVPLSIARWRMGILVTW